MTNHKAGRRAALKMLGAAPVGLAGALGVAQAARAHGVLARPSSTPIHARAATGPVEPGAGAWRTWLIGSGSELRLPVPPDSAAEVDQVRAMAGQRDAAALDRIAYWDAGSAAYRWNEIAIEHTNVRNTFGNNTGGRALALVNVAIYDATVTAWDSKYAHGRPRPSEVDPSLSTVLLDPRSPSYPCEHAVAAGAAATVLGYLFPAEAPTLEALAEEAAHSRVVAGVQYPSDARAGLELGRAVGARVVAYARTDNSDARWAGEVPTGPGLWTGTNPGGVAEATWRPWALSSPGQLRLAPPPAWDSAERAAELAEVKGFERTPRTNGLALMWQYGIYGGPNVHVLWNRMVSQKVFEERLDDNAPRAARAYAMQSVALIDAYIASQDSKFAYWTARPNQFDPTITTVFPTPNFPSYPSNAAVFNGATAAVLGHLFPRDARHFQELADQAGESRIWAGIHFRTDIEGGRAVARGIADLVIARMA